MKKWMSIVLVIGLMAGTASAAWWFGSDEKEPEAPAIEQQQMRRGGGPKSGEQSGMRKRQQPTEEQRAKFAKMKAERESMGALAESARNETDPVKKEALVGELREKLTVSAERMQKEFRKRLQKAESEVDKMKTRLEEAEKNKLQRIEDHLQKILSGEYKGKFDGRRPGGKRPEGAPRKRSNAPVE